MRACYRIMETKICISKRIGDHKHFRRLAEFAAKRRFLFICRTQQIPGRLLGVKESDNAVSRLKKTYANAADAFDLAIHRPGKTQFASAVNRPAWFLICRIQFKLHIRWPGRSYSAR